ncbi:MAG: sirohydrochlorin cobaltochelatase [Eggerthellaceae bacterium]|nr:sirohydrochlorin cobaltochelatase [Eggerthellaceae bacterium]
MKRGMLFVSFGTSHEETRVKTIDAIEAKVRETFPDCTPYSAWTSGIIIKKVKAERGEHHDTLDEALARMAADGVEDLIVSTTCLMEGAEMAKIRKAVDAWSDEQDVPTKIAQPLLSARDDRVAVAKAVIDEFSHVGESDALLLMGHGSPAASNEVYSQIQDELHALGRERFFVATVEGEPTFDDVWPLIEASGAARVYLAPLMIVAGDHAANDLAGDDDDSWASMVAARGLEAVPVLKGLGEYAGIQQLVCDHVQDALTIREVALRG